VNHKTKKNTLIIVFITILIFSINFKTLSKNQIETKMIFHENFKREQTILLEKGYTVFEINQIYEYMSKKNIDKILENEYVDLKEFFGITNFDFEKIDSYKAYQSIENIPMKDAVTKVNLKLDVPFYSETIEITNPDSLLVLVNKVYVLNENYKPENLLPIPSFPNLQLRKEAIEDFEKLLAQAKLDNIFLIPYSTYRSFSYQKQVYEKYLEKDPKELVDTYSARPGHSEHQTGLAIDIRSKDHWYNLTKSDYEWMKQNAYKYGFIIRYSKNNSNFTGYKEEPWHIRYVGIEHAKKITDLKLTFDEYYDLYINIH